MELQSFKRGVLKRILVKEGEEVPVGKAHITFTFDHRVVNGFHAALFVKHRKGPKAYAFFAKLYSLLFKLLFSKAHLCVR